MTRLHIKDGLGGGIGDGDRAGGGFGDIHLVETDSFSEPWNPTERVQRSPKLDITVYYYIFTSVWSAKRERTRVFNTLHVNWLP